MNRIRIVNCNKKTIYPDMKLNVKLLFIAVWGVCAKTILGQSVTFETVRSNGYTFSISDSQLPWAQAKIACEARGQQLASVESPEKDDILVQLFVEKKDNDVSLKGNTWVSATEAREGVWYWASLDKPLYHSRWFKDGQPDDRENLNCVYLASQWLLYWRDANCSASMYFMCEGEPSPEVTYEDAHLNGLTFSVSSLQLPWAQAKSACEARGQKLASVESPGKDDTLVQLFVEQKNTSVALKGNSWVSATEAREGVWYWASLDKPLYHSRWFKDGQPDDRENLNCVYLASQWLLYWRDANCSASMYFICEGEPPSQGTTSFTDSSSPVSNTASQPTGTSTQPPTTTAGSSPHLRFTSSIPLAIVSIVISFQLILN